MTNRLKHTAEEVQIVRIRKKLIPLVLIFLLLLGGVATYLVLSGTGNVTIVSDGREHGGLVHYFYFRTADGWATAGAPRQVQGLADALTPIPLTEDFQVMITGWPRFSPRYSFHRLIDDEWVRVLTVQTGRPDSFYLTHGRPPRVELERVYAESVLDLLEPGEYILEVFVSWGSARSGHEGQYLFRLTRSSGS